MKIKKIEVEFYKIPSDKDRGDSIQSVETIELPLVKIYSENGICGIGYSYTIGKGGSSVASFIRDELKPLILNESIFSIEKLWSKMWWETHWVGRTGIAQLAIAAVDIALWDLLCKSKEIPLYKLLGGFRNKVPAYGSDGGWLSWSTEQLEESAKKYVDNGFNAIKMKVGKDNYLEDIKRVESVRKAIGDNVNLMVDANQKWTASEAIKISSQLEKHDIYWLEEPLIPDDTIGHKKVSDHLNIPIALGESLYNKYRFKEYFTQNSVDIVQADVIRVGGITEWMKIAHMAEAFNLKMAPHHMMEIHLQLVAAVPNGLYVEYIPWLDEVLQNPLKPDSGNLIVPEEPGHGVKFDFEALKQFSASF